MKIASKMREKEGELAKTRKFERGRVKRDALLGVAGDGTSGNPSQSTAVFTKTTGRRCSQISYFALYQNVYSFRSTKKFLKTMVLR